MRLWWRRGTICSGHHAIRHGIHSIGWPVSDSAGRAHGIAIRFFFIRNTGPVAAMAPAPVTVMAQAAATAALAALDADAVSVGDARWRNWGAWSCGCPPA